MALFPRSHVILASLFGCALGGSLLGAAAGCRLTPAQAAEVTAIEKPLCEGFGGVAALEVPGLGGIVGLLCQAVANEITAAETVGPDGGVLPVKAAPLTATRGCVPTLITGDPFRQRACPELHARVLAASRRVAGMSAK